jgi:hypothetical protein
MKKSSMVKPSIKKVSTDKVPSIEPHLQYPRRLLYLPRRAKPQRLLFPPHLQYPLRSNQQPQYRKAGLDPAFFLIENFEYCYPSPLKRNSQSNPDKSI